MWDTKELSLDPRHWFLYYREKFIHMISVTILMVWFTGFTCNHNLYYSLDLKHLLSSLCKSPIPPTLSPTPGEVLLEVGTSKS